MSTHDGFDYDAIVVGSGFGGSVSALRLSEKGYKVAVIERGRRYRPKDFPETNWNVAKSIWMPALGWFGILRLSLMRDVFILSGSGVGGGSLVYANTLYVPPDAFFQAPQWRDIADWKRVLMPFYRTAQFMLGVTQNVYEGEPDRMLRDVASQFGKEETYVRTPVGVYFGTPNETVPDPYFDGAGPERTGCNFCGGCMVGCRFDAKNSLDKNYLYFAEKLGATIIAERTVTNIRPIPGGYELEHVQSGPLKRDKQVLRARKVVLSAGVLGTVQLLLECKANGSLPALSPRLGDVVRTNSEAIVGADSRDEKVNYSKGIAITSSVHLDEHTHVEVVRYSEGSDALAPLATLLTDGGGSIPRPLRFLGNIARHPLNFLRSLWPFDRARRGVFLLVMQSLDNDISLRLRKTWRSLWQSALDTDQGSGEPNPTYIPLGNEFARAFGKKAGGMAYSSIFEVLFDMPTTAHILGGAVVGASADKGVIDHKHEVFNYPGLYVCDGAAVPANLGVNPSLTITAMAEHAMSHIPVKQGAELRPAINPAFRARREREIDEHAKHVGNDSLQTHKSLPLVRGR